MRIVGIIVGIVLAGIGGIWALQGVNSAYAPQSFMTGSQTWLIIGIVTLGAGSALAVWSWRRPH